MWAKAGIAAIALGAAGAAGWRVRDHDYQMHLKADSEAALKASEQAREVEQTSTDTSNQIGLQVEEAKERIRYVNRQILKEVPVYVTQESDARCVVPDGAVRVLDAASTGNPPVPYGPGQSPDAPSRHDLSGLVSNVVGNYGYTLELEAQVKGWQDWYAEQKANWPVK